METFLPEEYGERKRINDEEMERFSSNNVIRIPCKGNGSNFRLIFLYCIIINIKNRFLFLCVGRQSRRCRVLCTFSSRTIGSSFVAALKWDQVSLECAPTTWISRTNSLSSGRCSKSKKLNSWPMAAVCWRRKDPNGSAFWVVESSTVTARPVSIGLWMSPSHPSRSKSSPLLLNCTIGFVATRVPGSSHSRNRSSADTSQTFTAPSQM